MAPLHTGSDNIPRAQQPRSITLQLIQKLHIRCLKIMLISIILRQMHLVDNVKLAKLICIYNVYVSIV